MAGCASTTPGKKSRAGLQVSACKVLALANKLPQVKPSIQRQLAHGNQLPDQKLLNLAQQTAKQHPAGSSMALGAMWAWEPPEWAMSLSYLQTPMPYCQAGNHPNQEHTACPAHRFTGCRAQAMGKEQ